MTPPSLDDIRDIRGPIAIPVWWHWPLAIALAALLSLGVVLLARWWRSSRRRGPSPLERARTALEAAEVHARAGRCHEWAEIVAETLRGALAERLGRDVLPQSTAELARAPWAGSSRADELDAPRILALLENCDLARFAKAGLESDALLAETAVARELVERLHAPPNRRAAIESQPQLVTS